MTATDVNRNHAVEPAGRRRPPRAVPRPPRRRPRRSRAVPALFFLPALLAYGIVVVYPAIAGSVYAFTDWNGRNSADFIGLDNFARLFREASALSSIINTLLLTLVLVVVQGGLGLALALGLHNRLRTRSALRVIFFLPAILPSIVVAIVWQYLYVPGGPIDSVLRSVGLDGLVQSWLGNPAVSLWSVAAVIVWQNIGISMVIFLAGLQRIPPELYEVAEMDGASAWQKFWMITRPLLVPAATIVVALTFVGGMKLFDQVFVMTGGGPGYATQTLSLLVYKQAFVLGNAGYSTAIALVLTAVVAFFAFVQISLSRRLEVET